MEQKRFPIFSERFAELRGDMTQGEFADFLNVSRPTVGFYENGVRVPDVIVLRQIAERCGVSADWLLGLTDVKSTDPDIHAMSKKLHLSETAIDVMLELAKPDDFGGDIDTRRALNVLLEGLARNNDIPMLLDTEGYALVDISNYFQFTPISEEDISDSMEEKSNLPRETITKINSNALKAQLLNEIGKSLDYLKEKFYR